MAPKVCVPADFGRHHIGAPSHGNLTFNLQQGLQIKANSIILSLNSPVIDDLTTNLHLTSLEAEDFSREAVNCFIEASYTGEVDALNLGNFRDVNKMSVVFNVSWLVARCEKYFVSYLDKLDSESSYPDMLFAVEEAVYLLSALKKRDFLNLVVKKMNIISVMIRDNFINQYLSDLSASTSVQIDVCIDIVKTDVHVLVELLIAHLKKKDKVNLDKNSRLLFKNMNLSFCHKRKPEIHRKLFSVLESVHNIKKEDYKLLLGKLEQNTALNQATQLRVPLALGVHTGNPHGELGPHLGPFSTVALASFRPYVNPMADLVDAIVMLSSSKMVDNLYKLIDGIWLRLRQNDFDTVDNSTFEKLVRIKEQNEWKSVDYEYVDRLFVVSSYNPKCAEFLSLLKNCSRLVTRRCNTFHASCTEYNSADEFVENIFKKDSDLKFWIDNPDFVDISYTLSITAMKGNNPDSSSMRWAASSKEVLKEVPELHFALERWKDGKWSIFPITWSGKPTCIPSGETWCWGYIWFGNKDSNFEDLIKGNDRLIDWHPVVGSHPGCRYRFVLFVV